jgi:CheY-like chemotaxis protein
MQTDRRLLLIDDSPDNLEFLTELLSARYRVYSYGSGSTALLDVPVIRPDLLLLDIRMSPIDGVAFLREARALEGFEQIPAIAITALAQEVERQRLLREGFQAVVTKPIADLPSMEIMIDRLLSNPCLSAPNSAAP